MNSTDGLGQQTDSVIKNLPEIVHNVEFYCILSPHYNCFC